MHDQDLSANENSTVIRPASGEDAPALCRIYNHYVQSTHVAFEESTLSSPLMADRVRATIAAGLPWLVAERGGRVAGYAFASAWRSRSAYRYTVESSVYLEANVAGRGLGTELYGELLDILGKRGMHSVIGGIALPNDASVALHEKLGFEKVAQFREVGYKRKQWVDVGYWQLIF